MNARDLLSAARQGTIPPGHNLRQWALSLGLQHGARLFPYIVLIALIAVYATKQQGVLTQGGISIETAATLTLALAATGQTIVILMGGIALSIGGVISLSTVILATKSTGEGGLVLWLPVVLVVGLAAGALNGIAISIF
ncbi:MAG: hypothetical protein ACKVQA_11785, partial [Burkholderiales bacterium]